jgi:predicted nucleic acid-binding protein
VNIVDSSGWLEYFGAGTNAQAFADVIEGEDEVVVPAIVLFEVGRRVWQQRGQEAAEEAMEALRNFRVIEIDASLARQAVAVGMEHKLAMADSFILATAMKLDVTVWTQDADFQHVPGIQFLSKPPP